MPRIGLNAYGLAYTLGLQGRGTARENPGARGLDGLLDFARRMNARVVEVDWRWLVPMTDAALTALGRDLAREDCQPIVSAWIAHEPGETLAPAFRVAQRLDARLIRLHLTPVLEGARNQAGDRWPSMVSHVRRVLNEAAATAAPLGLDLAIENHQDFGSEELVALAREAGDNVGLVFDTGNPFAVGEDSMAFARRVRGHVRHVHLKDYRAQFTSEGYRLVRCALGAGCVPLSALLDIVEVPGTVITASLEPAALEARHIRAFTSSWWQGYPPRDAAELGAMLERLQRQRHRETDDIRTPWEAQASPAAICAYEATQFEESVAYLRRAGIA